MLPTENDPNGIVFDPVHGVIHHHFQKHLAAPPGGGPVYGHFASKDMVKWAALPVSIWYWPAFIVVLVPYFLKAFAGLF